MRTDILEYTSMHKRLVSGCSLDVAKNSDLYLEQFISSSEAEMLYQSLLLSALGPFFEAKQLSSGRSG